ncbi:hypothetical protein CCAX7_45890 [Capsulimonas corticalis]|uniref:Uncharacterized protein n=1 Tax=Capsulimonas corticalis TaxID=2219043 RepID=A0A402D5A5_9BACT|nr:alpha-galactosidase [Capsulimonas corticalis]BDI32538.1 hypothetical protein CCAX7_45890 [Capsulimonas corticalis]
MPRKIVSEHYFSDTTVRYTQDEDTGWVGLEIFPTVLAGEIVARRQTIRHREDGPWEATNNVDSLVHLKIAGEAYGGMFAQGRTLRNAPGIGDFQFVNQTVVRDARSATITTFLAAQSGLRLEHRLNWRDGEMAAVVATTLINGSDRPVTLEMLTSFSLGNITPFVDDEAPGRLRAHRFRSAWCAEGRLDTQTIEQLQLERCPSGASLQSERFGQVGSMASRGWFPAAAIEDTVAGVTWAANVAWGGSWQMEIFRRDDQICLSGGLADREFGQWMKTIAPGARFETPSAAIACVQGDIDDACHRLTHLGRAAADLQPADEQNLPIIYNEWCTHWGDTTHERVMTLAKKLKGSGVEYFVIDAGWYMAEGERPDAGHGDWIVNPSRFPDLEATGAALRELGFRPGLWFEAETCSPETRIGSRKELMLHRDGVPITVSGRHFLDLTKSEVISHLSERVIGLLERTGFGYVKIDYNETIGVGVDGAEALGEGLRRQTEGTYRFFDAMRERLPDLVIENCASGGNRLEPGLIGRAAMSCFSDAMDLEAPLVAAHVQRLCLPRQMQIWAVVRESHPERRLCYGLAAGFLGRMALGGDVDRLSDAQMSFVVRSLGVYQRSKEVIKHGKNKLHDRANGSWRRPEGWQAVVRLADDGQSALAVVHRFGKGEALLSVPLPAPGEWRIDEQLQSVGNDAEIQTGGLACRLEEEFSACVVRLRRA